MDNRILHQEQEENIMAVLAKPCDVSFEVSKEKTSAFLQKDTKPAFTKVMERLEKHGGKIKIRI